MSGARRTDWDALLAIDRERVWHPYGGLPAAPPAALPVVSAEGVRLRLADGRELIDGMASWWCAIHGYRHPVLDAAVREQLERMAHVMFGGLTHEPAIRLAQRLVEIAPREPDERHGSDVSQRRDLGRGSAADRGSDMGSGSDADRGLDADCGSVADRGSGVGPGVRSPRSLERVFLADSGSVAVEVAIKLALQCQRACGHTKRTRLLALRGAYHGDTFGAMAACDPIGGMHRLFTGVLAEHVFAPRPPGGFDSGLDEGWAAAVRELIAAHADELAAVIAEPVVQGAGGMWIYAPECVALLRRCCDEHGLLLILDEIATGFGRTGALFASEHAGTAANISGGGVAGVPGGAAAGVPGCGVAGIPGGAAANAVVPDIMCIGKALTGGYMTLAATMCTAAVAEAVSSGEGGGLMHGPTFMASPLACSVALASLELLGVGGGGVAGGGCGVADGGPGVADGGRSVGDGGEGEGVAGEGRDSVDGSGTWRQDVARIERGLRAGLEPARELPGVVDVRVLGAIGVVQLDRDVDVAAATAAAVDRGVWLRPFRDLIYAMPPYVIGEEALARVAGAMVVAAGTGVG